MSTSVINTVPASSYGVVLPSMGNGQDMEEVAGITSTNISTFTNAATFNGAR